LSGRRRWLKEATRWLAAAAAAGRKREQDGLGKLEWEQLLGRLRETRRWVAAAAATAKGEAGAGTAQPKKEATRRPKEKRIRWYGGAGSRLGVAVAGARRRGEYSTFFKKRIGSVYGIYLYLCGQYEG